MEIDPEPRILGDLLAAGEEPKGALYIQGEAEGAIANGERVRKAVYEEGDTFPIGTLGTVISSIGPTNDEYGYFILWDPFPQTPVFSRGGKVEKA